MEWYRMIRSKSFWVALFLGSLLVISHMMNIVIPYSHANVSSGNENPMQVPFSVCMFIMGYDMYGWQGDIFFRIAPLLAAIPYANSYYTDIAEGYIKNIQGRCKKQHYLIAKYIITFVAGGMVIVIPLILDIMGCMMFLPLHQPAPIGVYTISNSMLFYEHTEIYIGMTLLLDFMIGGMYAVLGIVSTEFIANKYLLLIFPYIFVTIMQMFFVIINFTQLDPVQISNPDLETGNVFTNLMLIVSWIAIIFIIYFIRGRRRDELV